MAKALTLTTMMRMARSSRAMVRKRAMSRTSTVPTEFRCLRSRGDALRVRAAIAGRVAADAVAVAAVVRVRAAVETPAEAHLRVAAIASLSDSRSRQCNRVRVALRRGPFAFAETER